ncbi:MAG: GAF domain-containing sensor histidine kinase, partial [Anaerolineae bacterium]|nr:GAF domain-containing sensor histidine kinase [Anaerolineae bacterium]
GRPVAEVFANFADHVSALRDIQDGTIVHQIDGMTVEVRISPVRVRRRLVGRLFVFNDVTQPTQAEQLRQEQQALADVLREFATQLNSNLDIDYVLSLIANGVGIVLPHDRSDIMLLEDDGYTVYIRYHAPYMPETAAALNNRRFDYRQYPLWAQAAVQGLAVIVPDTTHYPDWINDDDPTMEIRAYATAPLRVGGKLIGFLNVASLTPGAFRAEAAERLQLFADQVAFAMQNAQLYEQVKRQAVELNRRVYSLTVLQRLYKDIGFSFKLDHLIELALDAAIRLCMADAGYVALDEVGRLCVAHRYGSHDPEALNAILAERQGIVGQAITEERSILLIGDSLVSALPETQAQIALPLFTTDADHPALVGLIVLESRRPERFTEERMQMLNLLANRVASALENAHLVAAVEAHASNLEQLYERVSHLEQLKSDMIRIAAHDLKNPLHVILGYLDDLQREPPQAPLAHYQREHQSMERAAKRMHQIISEILSLERIERMDQHPAQPFDLCALVREAAAEYAGSAIQHGQMYDVSIDAHDCIVSGDPSQMREAITNFISNAVKYTPMGGQIQVRLTRDGDTIRFEVHDTGYGIPEDQQKHLFEPFYRVQTAETHKTEGTGL